MKDPKTVMVSIKLTEKLSDRLTLASDRTGISKTKIIEQGLEKRLSEIEKQV
jgi:predicted DNA-binding protein